MSWLRSVRVGVGVAVAAGAVAGCGSVGAGGESAAPSVSASGTAGPCGVPVTAAREGWTKDGVRILAVNATCLEYEVANRGGEPVDVSVVFGWAGTGNRLDSSPAGVVAAVPAGATVKGQLPVADSSLPGLEQHVPPTTSTASTPPVPNVKIVKVRSVPTSEAPSTGGACPASGVRVYADRGDAAMGLRAVGLHLENCGTADVTLDGYPQLQLLDEAHAVVGGVQVLKGGSAIATATGADAPPQRFVLKPGQGARSTLVWRNTNDGSSDPVNAPYVRVRATPDAAPVTVTPELDLGTTGRIGAGAWVREGATDAPG